MISNMMQDPRLMDIRSCYEAWCWGQSPVTTNHNCHCGADEDRAAVSGDQILKMPK